MSDLPASGERNPNVIQTTRCTYLDFLCAPSGMRFPRHYVMITHLSGSTCGLSKVCRADAPASALLVHIGSLSSPPPE